MNRKISTLFAVSLLFSSAFGSSALAQDFLKIGEYADGLEAGKTYHLVMEEGAAQWAYGFSAYSKENQTITPTYAKVDNTNGSIEDADAYLWSVKEENVSKTTTPEYAYVLTNVKTGQTLRFDKDGNALMSTKTADVNSSTDKVAFGNYLQYKEKRDKTQWLYVVSQLAAKGKSLKLVNKDLKTQDAAATTGYAFNLYEAADDVVADTELNDLYNSAGFNLKLDDKYKDVANIFADQRIKAIDVAKEVKVETGYSFPAGTYFAVSTPAGSYADAKTDADKLAYLMDCEFIAVSPTDNISQSAAEQKAGNGFQFTTVSGRELNKYTVTDKDKIDADKQATGSEISVYNACFTVKKNASVAEKYDLSLAKFRYLAATSTYKESAISIAIAEKKYGSDNYLCTQAKASNYIFSFVESNAVKGTSFLNEQGAAIYNIQFVSGEDDDKSENGKYLFAPSYANTMYAKGVVLTDTDMPEFQFVVTEVKGNDVTFTNRANPSVKFTAKLFDEGNDEYSLAISGNSSFNILNIEDDGDVAEVTKNEKLNLKWIKLSTPASTDKFNGTWDVEDETKVTISFARDNTPTSNKLYPTTVEGKSNTISFGAPTPLVAGAAQWQLVKSAKPTYSTLTYAYKVVNGENETVKYLSKGDTTAYYTYNFQLVADGEAVADKFLSAATTAGATYTIGNTATDFIVKDNVDGSVTITTKNSKTLALSIQSYNEGKQELDWFIDKSKKPAAQTLVQTPSATDVKTYLLSEAPEISWPAETGHVSIQSELGNYISMNAERDGIVVNSEEEVYYLNVTDKKAVVPSFYISRGISGSEERMFLFNPQDSINYYVGQGQYDKKYQISEGATKAIFKAGKLNAESDTLTTSIKGKSVKVAMKADNAGTQAGLNRFKFQIIAAEDAEGYYRIRQQGASSKYLYAINDKLVWGSKSQALLFKLESVDAPTANESIADATEAVKVIAGNGTVTVQGAAGKQVVVSNILGKVIASTVLTSDNATIAVPAGIVAVKVEGEAAAKVVVK